MGKPTRTILYYVSKKEGVGLNEYIYRAAALTAIENLKFIETTYQIDLFSTYINETIQDRIHL
jgi:hypothetical protein